MTNTTHKTNFAENGQGDFMPANTCPDVLLSTKQVSRWRNESRPAITQANWLTGALVEADILPLRFKNSRMAAVVVGLASKTERRNKGPEVKHFAAKVNPDYLAHAPARRIDPNKPETFFNPHAALKQSLRKDFDALKPDSVTLFPGYVFPDMDGGIVYLDNQLSDSDCDPRCIEPVARVLTDAYNIGTLCVGQRPLVRNEYGHVPEVSLPSVIRVALSPSGRSVSYSPRDFMQSYLEVAGLS